MALAQNVYIFIRYMYIFCAGVWRFFVNFFFLFVGVGACSERVLLRELAPFCTGNLI